MLLEVRATQSNSDKWGEMSLEGHLAINLCQIKHVAHQEEGEEITVCLKQGLVYLLTVRVAQIIYLWIGCQQSILHVCFFFLM